MRITQVQNSYLYEGLDRSTSNSMMLWESAGFKLREAALTADQIQQIFQSVEQGATDAGGNRTLLGKGKDAASAVNKAWEDLKTKIQDSGPIKAVDQKYDDVVAKIEKGLGGPDNAISKMIMGYRKFAKEHPIAQGFIYSALIAAAGISGAGLGGAAVLGLLKMTDKLLQGEKFSSAAYSGAKTGAMAFAASKLGDLIKGVKPGEQVPEPDPGSVAWEKRDFENYDYYLHPTNNSVVQVPKGMGSPFDSSTAAGQARDQLIAMNNAAGSGAKSALKDLATDPNLSPIQQKLAADLAAGKNVQGADEFIRKAIAGAAKRHSMIGDNPDGTAGAAMRQFMSLEKLQKAAMGDSIVWTGKKLSEGQVYMIFNRVSRETVMEGPFDAIKGAAGKAAGKAAGWLATKGKNLTTKVTADKLNSAWQKAGSPMDSDELAKFLQTQGVDQGIVDKVYTDLKLPAAGDAKKDPTLEPEKAKGKTDYASIKELVLKLDKKGKQRIAAYLQKQLGTA
jgi:hypothetical protein